MSLILDHFQSEVPLEHQEKMLDILKKVLPEDLLFEDKADFLEWIKESLPLIKWNECSAFPGCLSVSLLCAKSSQMEIETFFPEILKKWLIPQKEASILSFSHMYFSPRAFSETKLFIGEAKILIETVQEWHHAISKLALLSKEIITAIKSPRYASYILTKKIASSHLKATFIHRELNQLMQKFPNYIDEGILDETGLFLAISPKEFLNQRSAHHITRLIASIYLIRKNLLRSVTYSPGIHHIHVRFLHTFLEFPFCVKPVLGCLIGLNLSEDYEVLEDRHILAAVKRFIPEADIVKGSFYCFHYKKEKIKTLYLELEKKDGGTFTLSERQLIRRKLKDQLSSHIEKVLPPIFMTRNEEDILRNILMLRREIQSTKDLPQVIISLDQQTATEVIFYIVLVSLTRSSSLSLQGLLETASHQYSLFFERKQTVGYFRKKYPIDSCVFRLHLPREPSLLRNDLSLNFYLARERVVYFLQQAIGEFRDYNGGVVLKQTETLAKLKQEFSDVTESNSDLLENFFYSISPIERQATTPLTSLKILFQLLLEGLGTDLSDPLDFFLKFERDGNSTLLVICCQDPSLKEHLSSALDINNLVNSSLITSNVTAKGASFLCYIYEDQDSKAHEQFCSLIVRTAESWRAKIQSTKVLKVSIPFAPISLDPRLVGDEFTGNILRLLFEGLIRINKEGKFEHGVAESVEVSPDGKYYIFKLKKTRWNNGDPVVAQDFEYAWKKILSVDFSTPFAYLFYPIKNAEKAKQGLVSLDEVGIKAIDDQTLHVELNFPAPYFLELTAHILYSPVNHKVDTFHPNWPMQAGEDYVCNGGFQLKTHFRDQSYDLIKNPFYWDIKNIEIDRFVISRAAYPLAKQIFRKGEIDWLGPPFGPWDPIFEEGNTDQMVVSPNNGVYLYIFNTQRFPFQNLKLRQAFALAINKMAISKSLQTPTEPAYTPLLTFPNQSSDQRLLHGDLNTARQLFKEALKELDLTPQSFPVLSLLYVQGGIRDTAAMLVKQQWENAFNVQCRLEPLDWNLAFNKMKQGDFHIGGILWRSVINDPIYLLNSFRYSNERINLSRWENAEYQKLLDLADYELNLGRRFKYLAKAEEILANEIPFLPVFYTDFRAVVKKHILSPMISPLGIVDLKWTKFKY